MPIPGIRFGITRQEGDDTFVTFFLVLLILALGVVCWIIAPRNTDNLIGLAPRSAVLYAHASGDAVVRLQPFMPDSLKDLRPKEVAVFAVQSSGEDGENLDWGYLMSWGAKNPDQLSFEHPVLADLPRRQNDSVFVMAEGSASRAVELAAIGGSMAEDDEVAQSLGKVSTFSKNQMYVRPEGVQAMFGGSDLRPAEPQIVLWRQPDRLVFTSVGNVNAEIAQLSLSTLGGKPVFSGPDWADFAVVGDVRESKYLLLELILGTDWQERDAVTNNSGNRLLDLLSEADYLATGSLGLEQTKFMVHVGVEDDGGVENALLDYFATRKPVMRDVSMPDGSQLREMALDSKWLQFVVRGDDYRVLTSSEDDVAVPPYTILPDHDGSFWLADSPERLQSKDFTEKNRINRIFCLKSTDGTLQSWFKMGWLSGNQLCVEEIVDKSVVIYSNGR